ncbi:MAG: DNA replication/repair protein RecF [Azospirillaceae bacterium]
MAVRRLALTEFRGYARLALELDPEPVVLTGPNGAGKTNLLEAVSYLAPGRGLRGAALPDALRRGAAADARWAVSATLDTVSAAGPERVRIGTGMDPDAPIDQPRRVVRLDGRAAASQAELGERVALVWLTPALDRLFTEGASGRRRFLDRLVAGFFPAHARHAAAYERAMRERARLLRDGRQDPGWLGALEDAMATNGVALAAARREVVARLQAAAAAATLADGPFPAADIAIAGTVEDGLAGAPALAVEDDLRARLRDARRYDAAAGGASAGPHRADLEVRHRAKDMPAAQCSTGEQKALLIGLVLANARLLAAERGAPPLLLLDEVAAHLDRHRRDALYAEILALGAQAWLTGTDAGLFDGFGDRARRFRVEDARVTETPGTD